MKNTITIYQVLDLIVTKDYEEAQQGLRTLIAKQPNESRLYSLYHYCTEQLSSQIADNYVCREQTVVQEIPWNKWVRQAETQANRRNYVFAIQLLEQAENMLWNAVVRQETFPRQATNHKDKILLRETADVLLREAQCFYLLGQPEQAKEKYMTSLQKRFQTCGNNVCGSVDILLQLKQFEEALVYVNHVLDKNTCPASTYECRSKIYQCLGKPKNSKTDMLKALECYQQHIRKYPLDYLLYEHFTTFLIETDRYRQALGINAKAIALNPNFLNYLTRARIYAHLQERQHALATLAQAEEVVNLKERVCGLLECGKIYELLGDYAQAERYYKKARQHPGDSRDCLAALYRKMDCSDKILRLDKQLEKQTRFENRVSSQMLAGLLD